MNCVWISLPIVVIIIITTTTTAIIIVVIVVVVIIVIIIIIVIYPKLNLLYNSEPTLAVPTIFLESHNLMFYLEAWESCQNSLFLSRVFLAFHDG